MDEQPLKTSASRCAKKRFALCTVTALFVAVIGLLVANHDSTPMPVYEGKTAREWMYGDLKLPDARFAAFHAMGSNAVPFLVHELGRKKSFSSRCYERVYPRLPRWITTRLSPPTSVERRWNLSATLLMNVPYRTALPDLTRLVNEGVPTQQVLAMKLLGAIAGPDDTNCIPPLVSCAKSPDRDISYAAVITLIKIKPDKRAIPWVTNLLTATNKMIGPAVVELLKQVDPKIVEDYQAKWTREHPLPNR